jgi:hypothetical protein
MVLLKQWRPADPPALGGKEDALPRRCLEAHRWARQIDEATDLLLEVGPLAPMPTLIKVVQFSLNSHCIQGYCSRLSTRFMNSPTRPERSGTVDRVDQYSRKLVLLPFLDPPLDRQ